MTSCKPVEVEVARHVDLVPTGSKETVFVLVHDPWACSFPMFDNASLRFNPMEEALDLVFDQLSDDLSFTRKDGRVLACWLSAKMLSDDPPTRIVVSDRIAGDRASAIACALDAALNGADHAISEFLADGDFLPDDEVFRLTLAAVSRQPSLNRHPEPPEGGWEAAFGDNHARWHALHRSAEMM